MTTSQFLQFYVSNLAALYSETYRNQQSIQQLNDNIKTLRMQIEQKLQQLFASMIKKRELNENLDEHNAQIKIIYLLTRQMQKCEADKRSLTRESCDILDKYLASIDQKVSSSTPPHVNAVDNGDDLLKTLSSIQLQTNQPVQGNAVIIDLIRKMENGKASVSKESNVKVFGDVNKNMEVFRSVEHFKGLPHEKLAKEAKSNVSDLMHRMDNLQGFTNKVIDICLGIKKRYKIEEPTNSHLDADQLINNEEENSEEDAELCHCRSQDIGAMVACDNSGCKIRWYHFECVGLYKTPEGLWYCPSCLIFENVQLNDTQSV